MEEGEKECATFSCSLDSGGLHGDAEGERRKKKRQRKSAEYKLHPRRISFQFILQRTLTVTSAGHVTVLWWELFSHCSPSPPIPPT